MSRDSIYTFDSGTCFFLDESGDVRFLCRKHRVPLVFKYGDSETTELSCAMYEKNDHIGDIVFNMSYE